MLLFLDIPVDSQRQDGQIVTLEKGKVFDFPTETTKEQKYARFLLERGYAHEAPQNPEEADQFAAPSLHPQKASRVAGHPTL